MVFLLYNVFLLMTFCIALPLVPFLMAMGDRFRAGFAQRLGFYPDPVPSRPSGTRPIWIHAASVGEVRAAKVLIDELQKRFRDRKIVLSTFTQTGNAVARQVTGLKDIIFLPLDLVWIVRRAIRIWNPAVLIIIETEIWPNLLREAHQRGIPTLLVSGRISDRAFSRYSRFGWFFREVIQCFNAFGMQSKADGVRITDLGADPRKVLITGNLKLAAFFDPNQRIDGECVVSSEICQTPELKNGFLWVVGSSHQGEEEVVLSAFETLKTKFPTLRMVLAPRHPQRFRDVEKLLRARGVAFDKKSEANGNHCFEKDVMLLDTIGDLESFYAAGDIAFVGGSLVDAGGHNLLEPARLRKPVLFGPYTSNFTTLAKELIQKGGGILVRGCEDLVREITTLLVEPKKRKMIGNRAYQVAVKDSDVLDGSVAMIARYLQG